VHLVDVGTGLAMLVRGADFTMVYDGGSNDDTAIGRRNRLIAYLRKTLGPSGDGSCVPEGDGWPEEAAARRRIDHLFVSHPHQDHVMLLPDVLRCYEVANVWEPGAVAETGFYRAFVDGVAAQPGAVYHTSLPPPDDRVVRLGRHGTRGPIARWVPMREGERFALGALAEGTILHARETPARDPNAYSIVVRLQLGPRSVLLTGDAPAGPRHEPSAPPARDSIEAHLLERHRAELDVDILQVGHHGSQTSSRTAFLDAVSPEWALIGAGPMEFGRVVLPDAEVVRELERRARKVLRTDEHDAMCGAERAKVGADQDGKPGGCDNWVLEIAPDGAVRAASVR
jgi:competence protein ComEC